MSTAHISSKKGDFAKTVLMPGDPLRSKFIAETFLEGAILINDVRGIQGYTGTYKNTKISVMASGMGMPSIGIYSYELFNFYDVDNIIRIGSAGGFSDKVNLRDIVFAMGASTNSNYASQYKLNGTFSATASYDLLAAAVAAANALDKPVKVGNILTSDAFYNADETAMEQWTKMGILCVEMEAAALYMNAANAGKSALAMMTISDKPLDKLECSPQERQTTFTDMMEIALNTAVTMEK
ncbi:MAG: purine-nucleoside phosphorylase [Bacillota bacterium]